MQHVQYLSAHYIAVELHAEKNRRTGNGIIRGAYKAPTYSPGSERKRREQVEQYCFHQKKFIHG